MEVIRGVMPQPHCQPGSEHSDAAPSKAVPRALLWMVYLGSLAMGWTEAEPAQKLLPPALPTTTLHRVPVRSQV